MKVRLFIGVTAPAEWKEQIGEFRRSIKPSFSESFARWTLDDNLHLTLRFLGAVEQEDAVAVGEALQKVTSELSAFSVEAGSLGCFPDGSRPRIVWLGFKGAIDKLIDLEGRIRSATGGFGQAPEDRSFHPHLTLARVNEARRQDREVLAELIRKGAPIEVADWRISGVELIRSELKPTGSVYTRLAAYPLGA